MGSINIKIYTASAAIPFLTKDNTYAHDLKNINISNEKLKHQRYQKAFSITSAVF